MSQQPKTDPLLYVAAALLPITVLCAFFYHNTQLPGADAIGMFSRSFTIYHYAMEGEWGAFFKGIYNERDWRPTAYYVFLIPLQFLTGGDFMRTAQAAEILSRLVMLYYTLRLLMLVLPARSAALGTAVLGLLPAVQWPAGMFAFSEGIFMPAAFAAIYYLIISDYLASKRFAVYFVIAATIAFITRPVESLSHLGPVFSVFLYMAYRRGLFTWKQLYVVGVISSLLLSLLLVKGWIKGMDFTPVAIASLRERGKVYIRVSRVVFIVTAALLAGGIGKLAYTHRERIRTYMRDLLQSTYIVHSFCAFVLLTVLFFIGHVPQLVEWVYSTSLGELAVQIEPRPLSDIILEYFTCAGVLPFTCVALLGIASFLMCIDAAQRKVILRHPLMLVLAMIPLTLILVLGSKQYFSRKVTLMVLAFLMVCMVAALAPGRFWRTRVVMLTALLATQFAGGMYVSTGHEHGREVAYIIGSTNANPRVVTTDPNPHTSYYEFMREMAQKHGIKNALLPMTSQIDPFQISAMCHMGGVLGCRYPFIPEDFDDSTTIHKMLKDSGAEAIMLNMDTENAFARTPEEAARFAELVPLSFAPNDKMKYALLRDYSLGVLETKYGLKQLECRIMPATKLEACMFLIKN